MPSLPSNIIALIFSTSGSFFTAAGLIAMKVANIKIEKKKSERVIFQKEWILGLFFMWCGLTLNACALNFGSIMLISSTSCFTIIFSALLAPIILGEQFSWHLDGITILLVASGSMIAVSQQTKPQTNSDFNAGNASQMAFQKLTKIDSLLYFGFIFLLILARNRLIVKVKNMLNDFYSRTVENYYRVQSKMKQNEQISEETKSKFSFENQMFNNRPSVKLDIEQRDTQSLMQSQQTSIQPLLKDTTHTESMEQTRLNIQSKVEEAEYEESNMTHDSKSSFLKPSDRILIKIVQKHTIEQIRFLEGKTDPEPYLTIHFYIRAYLLLTNQLSGIFGGMTSVMGKLFLLQVGFSTGYSFLFSPMCWVTGLSVIFTVFMNLSNLNFTISLYSQLLVMPTYECCIIFGTLASGGIVMNEFSYYTNSQLFFIFCGSCIAILGIMFKILQLEVDDEEDDNIKSKINDDNFVRPEKSQLLEILELEPALAPAQSSVRFEDLIGFLNTYNNKS